MKGRAEKMGQQVQLLKISENGRFLVQEDGSPFFWLGDTAWELFHMTSREEAELYLHTRAEQKFTVVQAVALAELDGLETPNVYGRRPLKKNAAGVFDPALPDTDGDDSYWDHVDFIVDEAAKLGLYIALVPTWGDKYNLMWGKGPEIFTPENARVYGEWIGSRYRDRGNIIWVLGGDRPLLTAKHFAVNSALAEGIRAGDGGRHLITLHPCGESSSSGHVHDEAWLDFNMIQSGHGLTAPMNYTWLIRDYARTPVKPTLDAEPCYEDHPRGFQAANGYFDDADVRKAAYYNLFSGGFGHTYGHHSIWSMTTDPAEYFIMTWKDALRRPGAEQMKHVRMLIESRPFLERIPDQTLIADNPEGSNYQAATRGDRYAFIYFPNGIKGKVRMGVLPGGTVSAAWFDPRTGESIDAGEVGNHGIRTFMPPLAGRCNDWVLVLDSK